MRISVLANRDLASNIALNLLFQRLPQHQYRVFLSETVGRSDEKPAELRALTFAEQTLFNHILFPALSIRTPQFNQHLFSFDEFSALNIPVKTLNDANSTAGMDALASGKPELLVSIRYGCILKAPVIALPEFGVLNLHSGLLPYYRGVMATFWAMLEQSQQAGTTLHYIQDAGIDTGDIVSINPVELNLCQSYLHNVLSLYPGGIASLVETIAIIEQGKQPPTQSQPLTEARYFSYPSAADLAAFTANGLCLFCEQDLTDIAKQYFSLAKL